MTINSYDSQFHTSVNHHTGIRRNQSMHVPQCDITYLCHAPAANQKGVADLCLHQLQLMHVQMRVHTSIKDFIAA